MLRIYNAKFSEKSLMRRVEKAVLSELGQEDIFETSVTVVDADTIKKVNASARGVDKVTDVLSFPYLEKLSLPVRIEDFSDADMNGGRVMLGDILICRERTEEQAKESGAQIKVGKFPMLANSRAKTNHEPDGFVKVIADAETDRVLGVWIIASVAGTMIAEAALAMEFGATSEDIAYTCHAHPTHSEALKEAAMAVQGKPIHI